MCEHAVQRYVALCPADMSDQALAPLLQTASQQATPIYRLDADFEHGGTWAGAATLVEHAYHDCMRAGRQDILHHHNYELYMALARLRGQIELIHGSLTDLAEGAEKTRNFSLDRAYRIAHGLVDFIIAWRATEGADAPPLVILAEGFAGAQHLCTRFFLELARRGSLAGHVLVVVAASSACLDKLAQTKLLECRPVTLAGADAVLSARPPDQPIASEAEADHCFETLKDLKTLELHSIRLRAYYKKTGNEFALARVSLAALGGCNHFGYYHEARSFVADILPCFEQIVAGDEEKRWNFTGNIYHSLLVTGAPEQARLIVERLAEPHLTRTALRAKMQYVFGIHDIRYSQTPDLEAAERHLVAATQLIAASGAELSPEDFCFFRVFIDNGLALLRVRQRRRAEAITLCQSGFKLLEEKLSPDTHRLHRSVLQYNTAQVYASMGEFEAALLHYRNALEMDPNYSEYYNEMGNIYQRQGRLDDAVQAYDMAVRLSPPYPEVHFNRALCLARNGDWHAALDACRRSLDLNPDQPDALLVRAEIHEQLDMPQEALACYEHTLRLDAASIAAHVNKAVLLFNLDRLEDALDAINAAIALDGGNPNHYENRANIHRRLEQWDHCSDDEQTALRLLGAPTDSTHTRDSLAEAV